MTSKVGGFSMRKGISFLSVISIVVSVLGTIIYGECFRSSSLVPVFIVFSIASIILPVIAKRYRISKDKKGGWIEVVAIIIGGFNFYCMIFALTSAPIFIGYMGWIICGIVYKLICHKKKESDSRKETIQVANNIQKTHMQTPVSEERVCSNTDKNIRLESINHNADVRFQMRDPDQICDRELLANTIEDLVEDETTLNDLRVYKKLIVEMNEKQRILQEQNQRICKINNMSDGERRQHILELRTLQNTSRGICESVDQIDKELKKLEETDGLKSILQTERAEWNKRIALRNQRLREESLAREEQEWQKKADRVNYLSERQMTYSSIIRTLESISIINKENIQRETAILMVTLADYFATCKRIDRKTLHEENKQWLSSMGLDCNHVLGMRMEFYGEIMRGRELRGECVFGNVEAVNNPVIRCIIAFGDMIINPACIDNYDGVPSILLGFDDIIAFQKILQNNVTKAISTFVESI